MTIDIADLRARHANAIRNTATGKALEQALQEIEQLRAEREVTCICPACERTYLAADSLCPFCEVERLRAQLSEPRLKLYAEIERLRAALLELHCAVWECPREEYEEASHSDTVKEAHRVNKSDATCRALLREACETLRDITNNYDCDSDAHKYGTPCRTCEAKQVVTHVEAARAAGGGE